jgi:hypothetical protein
MRQIKPRRSLQPISIVFLVSQFYTSYFLCHILTVLFDYVLGEAPKGKDFDLKKIRSELKMPADIAATAAVKTSSPVPPNLPPPPTPVAFPTVPAVPTGSSTSQQQQPQQPVDSHASASGRGDDDIYEFREPEPFEFEVRARRESPFSEDRVHHRFTQRKSTKEEDEESSPKKVIASPVVKTCFCYLWFCCVGIT